MHVCTVIVIISIQSCSRADWQ